MLLGAMFASVLSLVLLGPVLFQIFLQPLQMSPGLWKWLALFSFVVICSV